MNGPVTLRMEQDTDCNEGWVGRNKHRTPNGSRVREDYEVEARFSCTNTDFGGDDPAEVTEADSATFDPRENIGEL
jgi:hypothetical protein